MEPHGLRDKGGGGHEVHLAPLPAHGTLALGPHFGLRVSVSWPLELRLVPLV